MLRLKLNHVSKSPPPPGIIEKCKHLQDHRIPTQWPSYHYVPSYFYTEPLQQCFDRVFLEHCYRFAWLNNGNVLDTFPCTNRTATLISKTHSWLKWHKHRRLIKIVYALELLQPCTRPSIYGNLDAWPQMNIVDVKGDSFFVSSSESGVFDETVAELPVGDE